MGKRLDDDTIAAISTPVGDGGIGIVRLSGPGALDIADEVFVSRDKRPPSCFKTYTTHYGHVVRHAKPADIVIDEALLTVMRAPKSYTREDVVEINCHGGIQAIKNTLELVLEKGSRLAEPGEFTKRAFLNGRIDLAQAEAVLDTIRARTAGAFKVAVSQMEGALSEHIGALYDDIMGIASEVEASIDFPEEGIETAGERALIERCDKVLGELQSLLDTYDEGMILKEGVLAVICGKPNVGKSSLMNLLLKRDRVIVSPIPGTTRDTVEEIINIDGIPIRLVDTAGIDGTKDALVRAGVARSKKYLGLSDIVIFMLDSSTGIGRADAGIIRHIKNKKVLVVVNKIDAGRKIDANAVRKLLKDDPVVEISVKKRRNIERLEEAILRMVWRGRFDQGESVILNNARHKELLDKVHTLMLSVRKALRDSAPAEIISVDLKEALHRLGLVIGKSVSGDMLDRIFGQFCIGK